MSRATSLLVGLLAFVLASGCATSRLPAEAPRTLAEVNRQLEGRWARVDLKDGRTFERVEDVAVGADSTSFYHRREARQVRIATASVAQVSIRGKTGAGHGAIMGAAPGMAVAAVGVPILVLSSDGDASSIAAAAVGMLMVGGGLVAGLVGGVAGALIGSATTPDEWRVVYEAPIERYQSEEVP